LPKDSDLRRRLEQLPGHVWPAASPVQRVDRIPNDWPGYAFATEFISVTFNGGVVKRLFAKHGPVACNGYARGGLPGGLGYELSAHTAASQIRPEGIPALIGSAIDVDEMSIFFEIVQGAQQTYQLSTLTAAARWIGVFQRRSQIQDAAWRSLNIIDREFFLQWAHPAVRAMEEVDTESLSSRTDLIRSVSRVYLRDVDLLAAPHVMVHGDFYAHNILWGVAGLSVVDWGMAAVGPGEMDLAMLTLGWPEQTVLACEAAYVSGRWPTGEPRSFAGRLLAARRLLLLWSLSLPPRPDRPKRNLYLVGQLGRLVP
jgi:hypothetical protein